MLRTATRVLLRLGEFHARDFEQLRQRASRLAFEGALAPGRRRPHLGGVQPLAAAPHRRGGASACALAIARSARAPRSRSRERRRGDARSPARAGALVHDRCVVSLDASGELLHQRGWRKLAGKAPLRETLAAALLLASGWDRCVAARAIPSAARERIAIEAALLARRLAPGRGRRFAFMEWPGFDAARCVARARRGGGARRCAERAADRRERPRRGRDRGGARQRRSGGRRRSTSRSRGARSRISSRRPGTGWIVCNPPYGVRLCAAAAICAISTRASAPCCAAAARAGAWRCCASDPRLRAREPAPARSRGRAGATAACGRRSSPGAVPRRRMSAQARGVSEATQTLPRARPRARSRRAGGGAARARARRGGRRRRRAARLPDRAQGARRAAPRRRARLRFVVHADLVLDAGPPPAALARALRAGRVVRGARSAARSRSRACTRARAARTSPWSAPGRRVSSRRSCWRGTAPASRCSTAARRCASAAAPSPASATAREPDPEANLLFGEGGAGTYSDGKLYTRVEHPLEVPMLEELVACGAPPEVLYDARAHVGTDRLHRILPALRARLEARGVRFALRRPARGAGRGRRLAAPGRARSRRAAASSPATRVLLAPGHSARDTWRALERRGRRARGKAVSARRAHRAPAGADRRRALRPRGRERLLGARLLRARVSRARAGRSRRTASACVRAGRSSRACISRVCSAPTA